MKDFRRISQPSQLQNGNKSSLYYALIVIFATGLLIAGCDFSKSRLISLDGSIAGQKVVVSVGDTIEVTLQTIGPGQYGEPVLSSGAVKFLEEKPASLQNPGGPRQIYRFKAIMTGETIITIPHTGGSPNTPESPLFSITITVK
jgi:hypothetical protein